MSVEIKRQDNFEALKIKLEIFRAKIMKLKELNK